MKKRRRLFSFLLLNVIVSAVTMAVVLTLWLQPAITDSGNPISLVDGQSNSVGDNTLDSPSPAQATGQLEITRIVGAQDLESERIEIHHVGESDIFLEGWRLRDEDGNEFIFPNFKMVGQGSIRLYTKIGTDDVVALYWGMEETVWETGEVATLLDPDGNPHATYIVP